MMLTTRGRYAVMAMVDIAYHEKDVKAVALHDISSRQEITINYLEQIFAKLKKANLVKSVRGPGGGYRLNKLAKNISILEVIQAIEEPIKMNRCHQDTKAVGCLKNTTALCVTHNLWHGLTNQISTYLSSISLYDVSNKIVK